MVNQILHMSENKLKQCPFCGNKAISYFSFEDWGFDTYKIVCSGDRCKIQTPSYQSRDDAIKSWNKRVNDE